MNLLAPTFTIIHISFFPKNKNTNKLITVILKTETLK